ncbi:cytochrome c oxidase subunit 1, partial [Wuchereria bancrofti]
VASTANIKLPETSVISVDYKKTFAQLLLDYRVSLVEHIKQDLFEMNQLLLSIKRQTRTRGDASAEDRSHLEEIRARYEKILTSGIQLSEYLGVEMETMKEEQSEDEEEEVSALALSRALHEGTITVWPDEDTRQFYETRMELRQLVPAILFQSVDTVTFLFHGMSVDAPVWGHHIYTTRLDIDTRTYFSAATIIIAIPSAIKIFNCVGGLSNILRAARLDVMSYDTHYIVAFSLYFKVYGCLRYSLCFLFMIALYV